MSAIETGLQRFYSLFRYTYTNVHISSALINSFEAKQGHKNVFGGNGVETAMMNDIYVRNYAAVKAIQKCEKKYCMI